MLVIAHHFIQNPDVFWSRANEVISSIPSTMKLHSVYPSKDGKTGTCVWEATSTQEVQAFLDKILGNVSKNVVYEVNEEVAIGLPKKTMEAASN